MSAMKLVKKYNHVSQFPTMQRDLSFVVDSRVSSENIISTINKKGGVTLQSARLFDVFENEVLGTNKKSLSYRIVFSSHERTLTDDEADATIAAIVESVQHSTGAILRA